MCGGCGGGGRAEAAGCCCCWERRPERSAEKTSSAWLASESLLSCAGPVLPLLKDATDTACEEALGSDVEDEELVLFLSRLCDFFED